MPVAPSKYENSTRSDPDVARRGRRDRDDPRQRRAGRPGAVTWTLGPPSANACCAPPATITIINTSPSASRCRRRLNPCSFAAVLPHVFPLPDRSRSRATNLRRSRRLSTVQQSSAARGFPRRGAGGPVTAVPETSSSSVDLTPFVPRVVVDWLRAEPEARHRRLEGTLAFVDISGFTALNERLAQKGKLGAEEVTEVMNRTFERAARRRLRLRRRAAQVRRRRAAPLLHGRGPRRPRLRRRLRDAHRAAPSSDSRRPRSGRSS